MSIPDDIKIGILVAGGKMGLRISANLQKLPNEIYWAISKLFSPFFCWDQIRHRMLR